MTVSGPPQSNTTKDAQAARKRRRRATAGGAADDCFACIRRNTKCDRRRPYCSQCLELGNDCSGYKTQLTWGVGVASRGKLRGLSLPIAKAPPVAPVPKKTTTRTRASTTSTTSTASNASNASTTASASASQWRHPEEPLRRPHQQRDGIEIGMHHGAPVPNASYGPYPDYPRFTQAEQPVPVSHTAWAGIPAYAGHMHHQDHSRYHKGHPGLGHYPIMSEPQSASADSLSEVDYTLSPIAHSYSREEVPYMQSPPLIYDNYSAQSSPVPPSPASAIMIEQRTAASCPSLVYAPSDHSSSLSSHPDSFEPHMGPRLISDSDALSVPELESYSASPHSTGASFWAPSNSRDDDGVPHRGLDCSSGLSHLSYGGHPLQVSPDLIHKMSFFMDYYENIMCPSLVLIDGPNNPYRDDILRLASSSQSLRHAICALSACNLRMKRRLSLGQYTRNSTLAATGNGPTDPMSDAYLDDRSLAEEHEHRNLAVHLLNAQLNDPSKACHDSVLATILLLCHYRMVESGVARFHTQFAGVKKILSMRNSVDLKPTRQSAWMEAVFTYFDSISASINEREAQLTPFFLGLSSETSLLPPGAENLVGCDRELFRTIHKLGRLNLLSQNRPVQILGGTPSDHGEMPAFSPMGFAAPHHYLKQKPSSFFNHTTAQYDGNRFATKFEDGSDEMMLSGLSLPCYEDCRATFWREWKDAHMALQTWEFDAQRLASSLPNSPTPDLIRDLHLLSEAFRYAALLYIERLASPHAPSNNDNSRNLVSQVIYYATSLSASSSAEKFLLWPLFIAGSECVNEVQQDIVRKKCREIMSRSGYMNNMAAMDVLEHLWRNDENDPRSQKMGYGGGRSGPFKWTKYIGGPGVDVEWIMF
ncbi:fungal-specific transcription factor domain-containing protein [Xylaria sp. CBS 124048]|nr:fungal-specific transcription factor domain-containing protein [Xylaria sp. CBS 124048]